MMKIFIVGQLTTASYLHLNDLKLDSIFIGSYFNATAQRSIAIAILLINVGENKVSKNK